MCRTVSNCAGKVCSKCVKVCCRVLEHVNRLCHKSVQVADHDTALYVVTCSNVSSSVLSMYIVVNSPAVLFCVVQCVTVSYYVESCRVVQCPAVLYCVLQCVTVSQCVELCRNVS